MERILLHNDRKSKLLTIMVFVMLFTLATIPLIFYFFFQTTLLHHFFTGYYFLSPIIIVLHIYFIYVGIYNYQLKFEDSSFCITSRRTLSSYFGGKLHHIEISNDMLRGFQFMTRPFYITSRLLIQIQYSSGRKSAVRIPMTLINKSSEQRIENILNNIIQKNECQKN